MAILSNPWNVTEVGSLVGSVRKLRMFNQEKFKSGVWYQEQSGTNLSPFPPSFLPPTPHPPAVLPADTLTP